jgi:subtilisin family serine protease
MPRKLDCRLRHLLRERARPRRFEEIAERVGARRAPGRPAPIAVLVRCAHEHWIARAAEEAGLALLFTIDGPEPVAGGTIDPERLETLQSLNGVLEVEASRHLVADLDRSRPLVGAQALHQAAPPVTGRGVIVGVIDGGIDYTHRDFRNEDGTSRILFLWDQRAAHVPGSPVPFGREYTKAELDAALAVPDPSALVPHRDLGAHGTHVAGIAAGNGLAAGGRFAGVAPAADLVVVAALSNDAATLGQSLNALAAFAYVEQKARGLARPVSINMSQGMNGGGHSGETVLEAGLDNLARRPGVVIVKSAGNEQGWRIHAGGALGAGQTATLELDVATNNRLDDVVEVWVDGVDRVSAAVRPPGGSATAFVAQGASDVFVTPAGNDVSIDSDDDAAGTGDTRITVILSRGSAAFIQPGRWRLLLRGDHVGSGRYDAWIERTVRESRGEQTRFSEDTADPTRTISIPGTARRVLTVGSFVTRGDPDFGSPPAGEVSSFSSRGPTRYGLQKPEIAAPGEFIVAPRSSQSGAEPAPGFPDYTPMPGTSMAAPHAAGAAALVLGVRGDLTGEEVKQVLMRAARRDGLSSSAPDNTWGDGKLDVEEAVRLAQGARFPRILSVQVAGTRLRFDTDVPTTAAVRVNPHARQLVLGRATASVPDLAPGTQHDINLAPLGAGAYFCEVLAFSQDNWRSTDDNQGAGYRVVV